jgi:hypothetical protein
METDAADLIERYQKHALLGENTWPSAISSRPLRHRRRRPSPKPPPVAGALCHPPPC